MAVGPTASSRPASSTRRRHPVPWPARRNATAPTGSQQPRAPAHPPRCSRGTWRAPRRTSAASRRLRGQGTPARGQEGCESGKSRRIHLGQARKGGNTACQVMPWAAAPPVLSFLPLPFPRSQSVQVPTALPGSVSKPVISLSSWLVVRLLCAGGKTKQTAGGRAAPGALQQCRGAWSTRVQSMHAQQPAALCPASPWRSRRTEQR